MPINKDRLTAIAVVAKYKAIVLLVIFPRLDKLFNDEMPETKEKNIRGTINIFKRLIKIVLPRTKMYFSTKRVA